MGLYGETDLILVLTTTFLWMRLILFCTAFHGIPTKNIWIVCLEIFEIMKTSIWTITYQM